MTDENTIILDDEETNQLSYDEKVQYACPIAQPMASKKLAKRLYKLARKARRTKKTECSIKAIVKAIEKKKSTGIVILAGDVSPIDSITHLPIICEEHRLPYCYVASKVDLGASVASVSAISALLVMKSDEYEDLYNKCYEAVDALPLPL